MLKRHGEESILLNHDEVISLIPVLKKLIHKSPVFVRFDTLRKLIQNLNSLEHTGQRRKCDMEVLRRQTLAHFSFLGVIMATMW